MTTTPYKIERSFNAQASTLWRALTEPDLMKQWYFDLPGFRPVKGYKFQFYGGPPEKQYLHLCEVTDVIPERKLAHTWRYDGFEGNSLLTFELVPEGNKTRLKLTHAGLDTFPEDNPDFAAKNFEGGWDAIINQSLTNFIEKQNYRRVFMADAFPEDVFEDLTLNIHQWWSTHIEGQGSHVGDVFTVRFGSTYNTIEVTELEPNKKVVWHVMDSLINNSRFGNKKEWVGTRITWDIAHEGTRSRITMTHEGLHPGLECFEVCFDGWNEYIASLVLLLETGTGKPA